MIPVHAEAERNIRSVAEEINQYMRWEVKTSHFFNMGKSCGKGMCLLREEKKNGKSCKTGG